MVNYCGLWHSLLCAPCLLKHASHLIQSIHAKSSKHSNSKNRHHDFQNQILKWFHSLLNWWNKMVFEIVLVLLLVGLPLGFSVLTIRTAEFYYEEFHPQQWNATTNITVKKWVKESRCGEEIILKMYLRVERLSAISLLFLLKFFRVKQYVNKQKRVCFQYSM